MLPGYRVDGISRKLESERKKNALHQNAAHLTRKSALRGTYTRGLCSYCHNPDPPPPAQKI